MLPVDSCAISLWKLADRKCSKGNSEGNAGNHLDLPILTCCVKIANVVIPVVSYVMRYGTG